MAYRLASDVPPGEIWQCSRDISDAVCAPELTAMAVDVVTGAGFAARVNEVGHIAIPIQD